MTLSFRELMRSVSAQDVKKVEDMKVDYRKVHGRYFQLYNHRYSSDSFERLMERVNKAKERWYAEPKPKPRTPLTKTFSWRQPVYEPGTFSNRFHEFYLWDFVYVSSWSEDIRIMLQGYDDLYTGRKRRKIITPALLRHILREQGYDLKKS